MFQELHKVGTQPVPHGISRKSGSSASERRAVNRFTDARLLATKGRRSIAAESVLSCWPGGPDLYVERFGHPRLRARHLPYPIGVDARDQWLTCMGLAMAEIGEAGGFTADMQERLMISFANTADHMRNRAG